ncbi:etoposide-induced protein 2.4 [Lutzomyia longipalpis]|uniref:Putative p53-mediated apoptosis protein n=1 Tax=Lutzomyia longipalpis TaxID=7200 RepID=A0A1B0CRG3_LUTLO|nr:etoposide-induced protein 2.4 [Lutzomyia longipalpis]
MDDLYGICNAIFRGCVDSIKGIAVVFYLDREVNKKISERSSRSKSTSNERLNQAAGTPSTVRRSGINKEATKREEESMVGKRVLQCCALNGGIFWAGIAFFEYLLLPILATILTYIFSESFGMTVWGWMQPFFSLIFQACWVLPLFIISKIVNSLWFQDIADTAYKFRKGRPQLFSSTSKLIADTLFSLIVQGLFLVQSMIVSFLPVGYVGSILCFLHMCLLYSLYSFEYKWFNMGWELHKRLTYIEYNWPYFFGFGIPLAIATQLPSSFIVSGCVFSILFPLFILSSNEATPVSTTNQYPLKLFSPVVAISNTLFSSIMPVHRTPGVATPSHPTTPLTQKSRTK